MVYPDVSYVGLKLVQISSDATSSPKQSRKFGENSCSMGGSPKRQKKIIGMIPGNV